MSVFSDSIDDAALVASVLDGTDGAWTPLTGSPVRIGIPDPTSLGLCEVATSDAFAAQVERLVAAGHEVATLELAAFVGVGDLLYGPWVAERAESVGDFVREHVDEVDPVVARIVLGGYEVTADDVVHGRAELDAARQGIEPVWSVVDVLLTPTVPFVPTIAEVVADPVELNRRLGAFTHPVNLLGWVAASVPGPRRPDGRPSGATVLAPPGRERAMTSVAADAHVPRR